MTTLFRKMQTYFFVVFLLVPAFSAPGFSQASEALRFPARPITFIVPVAAGATPDLACRLISKEAEKFLGQPVVVVNKPGASFTVGIAAIASSKPDGYTVGYTGHPGMFVPPLTTKVPFHPVKDLRQVMQFGIMNIAVTVKGDSPFKDFKDIVAFARQHPKKLTYGSAGAGSLGHLAMEQIARREKVQFTQIPFKGSPMTQAALMGGHILVGTGDFNYSLLESGQVRLILLIAEKPSLDYPNVPIVKDLGYDIPTPTFLNVAGPKGMPDEVVHRLDDAYSRAMKEPAFIKGMKDFRFTIFYRDGKDLDSYMAMNYEIFSNLLKEEGLLK